MNSYSDITVLPEGKNRSNVAIQVQVVFGMPSSSCAGSGVCKMLPRNLSLNGKYSCPIQMGSCEYDEGILKLSLPYAQLTGVQWQKLFADGLFRVQERFYLPRWLSKKLGLKQAYIPIGIYPFQIDDKHLRLHLFCCPLSASPQQRRRTG